MNITQPTLNDIFTSPTKKKVPPKNFSTPTTVEGSGGVMCVNAIIGRMWGRLDADSLRELFNSMISEMKPMAGMMEKVEISNLELGNDTPPKITSLKCQQTDTRTIIIADFEYEGDLFIEWIMRPRVVPLDLRCLLREVLVYGQLKLRIKYGTNGSIEEMDISLSEYPEMSASVHMFESLDFNSIANTIPSLTSVIKQRFKEFVELVVYPNTYPILQNAASVKNKLPLTLEPVGRLDELEDEIKKTLLDINTLLKEKVSGAKDKDAAKKEVFESVVQFLKYGMQPNRIPVSMIETVQRGFQILYSLVFEDVKNGEVCEPVFDVLLQNETMKFIGHVARMCSFADDLIRGLMSLKDDRLRSRVNKVFGELNLQDIPLTVLNRRE